MAGGLRARGARRAVRLARALLPALLLAGVLAVGEADARPVEGVQIRPAGPNVQRTLRLLRTSRPGQRNTVRILFYGQSITEQGWAREVEEHLRTRYPHAHLVVENRALGGFASQLLVKAAETDLYPFYPDLLVFHVYGAHDRYEDIVRRVRERTTAEIMLQTDHLLRPEELDEETDPERLPLGKSEWAAFMNHAFLPALARRYDAALCDQRAAWKRYLARERLAPSALLADHVHLAASGERLMAACVKGCLSGRGGRSVAEDWVKTVALPRRARAEGSYSVRFDGNRVDAILEPGASEGSVEVFVDGKKPSEWPALYGFTRAQATPGGKWPPVFELGSRAPLVPERWTLEVMTESREPERYRFALRGSSTGFDGEGRSDQLFVSSSGRVVIEPDDWVVAYALSLAGVTPVPERFSISFHVVPRFTDRFSPPPLPGNGVENVVTLVQGLSNGEHELLLRGALADVRALRVYRPPLREQLLPEQPAPPGAAVFSVPIHAPSAE